MEKKYLVKVKTPNRIVDIKGKLIRTPFEHIAREAELQELRTKLVYDSLVFTIDEYIKPIVEKKVEEKDEKSKVAPKKTINEESTLGVMLNETGE